MSGNFWWCNIGLHSWGKWSEPKKFKIIQARYLWGPPSHGRVTGIAAAQERTCKKCNMVEHRWVD